MYSGTVTGTCSNCIKNNLITQRKKTLKFYPGLLLNDNGLRNADEKCRWKKNE